MAKKQFLDSAGLTKLWAKIKAAFVAKETGKSLMLDTDKTKLDGIEDGAERNVIKLISKEDGPLFVDVTKGEVTIPTATDTDLGLIKESRVKDLAKAQAEAAASKVYRIKGSKNTIEEVQAVENPQEGDVWNVQQKFTLDGKKYPAGTNVVCVFEQGQWSWDPLGGTVDLDPYLTKEEAGNIYMTQQAGSALNQQLLNKVNKDQVATSELLGLVKSASSTTGDVTVDGDGFMTVDSIPDSEIDRICQ